VVARAERVTTLPAEMPLDVAAGFGVAYATSHHALKQRAKLRAGETLLVLGAAGGRRVCGGRTRQGHGRACDRGGIKRAKAGAVPRALCRCDDRLCDRGLRAGSPRTTGSVGPDVIYDPVGGDHAEVAFRSIALAAAISWSDLQAAPFRSCR